MTRILVCLCLILSFSLAIHRLSPEDQFQRFKAKYGKVYNSEAEERLRLNVFKSRVESVEQHNSAGNSSYSRTVNQWSDLTQAEWEATHLGGWKRFGPVQSRAGPRAAVETGDLPYSVDWREKGVITTMKDQGQCGSCWAFGTTSQIESYTALATGHLVELSSQQVTSCVINPLNCGGSGGCQGSTPPLGYSYIQLFGQVAEADYPYISGSTSNSETCQYDLSSVTPMVGITGYDNLPANDQEAIMNHIAKVGPLAISVAANSWMDYSGGVFSGCDYDRNIQLNHAVQLVGYGTDYNPAGVVDYWIVRNSWGDSWGEEGYIRLLRETRPRCGVDTATSGHVCQGGPGYSHPIHVCGMCGMLFETSFPLGAHLI